MDCNYDCGNCKYSSCLLEEEELTPDEIAMSEWLDALAIKDSIMESGAVIHTGKRGRPKSLFPKFVDKAAKKKKAREYYNKHKEERLAYQNKYNAEHREQLAQRDHERYLKKAEERKAKQRALYQKNIQNPDFAEKERQRCREKYRRLKCVFAKSI